MQLPDFSNVSVLVVGDVMLDCYFRGEATRISPEAPVPVVKVSAQQEFPGGAANVAMNVASLGAKCHLLGAVGEDAVASQLNQLLKANGIHFYPIPVLKHTFCKWRVLSHHQQLVRLDFEELEPTRDIQLEFMSAFLQLLPQADAVIFSDYGKGIGALAPAIIAAAKAAHKPCFVDPKTADYSVYQGATLITPNWKEFQQAVGSVSDETQLIDKAQGLIDQHELQALLVTRGEQGMTLVQPEGSVHFNARAKDVFDVTGAGDTVIATLTTAFAKGASLAQAVEWANIAAGVAVSKLGTATVTHWELRRALSPSADEKILSLPGLLQCVAEAKVAKQRIVMTNGCFDILHAGHVQYLTEAKALGDVLIVAVNDDASISALKGPQRPIQPLADRLAVLSGLSAVDYLIPFSQATPRELIEAVQPDILVKAQDYALHEIAGHETVLAAGGEVHRLALRPNCSTTRIVEKIQQDIQTQKGTHS